MIYAIIFLSFIFLGIIIANISRNLLVNYYNKYKNEISAINITSFELLAFFIKKLNLNLSISEYSSYLDNSYDIKRKIILLSSDVINSKSVPALSISMHELGHAIQHKNKSKLFYCYYLFLNLNKLTSILIIPLIFFLIISLFLPAFYLTLALILVVSFYLINLIIRIIIIPLEQNASKIALKLLKEYKIFEEDEMLIAKKLLNFAVLTYIGGFFMNYVKIFKKIIRNF